MTTSAPFRLETSSGLPFYRQIIDQVLLGVADGRLPAGTQLPTVRQLAVDLSVNLNTVAKAYREMEIRGIVETQQGTGTFVASRKAEKRSAERDRALVRLVEGFLALATARGFSAEEVAKALVERTEGKRRS
ncbi:MAG TPA: GntR family transcriptional regulator [Thermoanaerobaculia bacterium]|nr:GntR family transcriptional regulator [Thermoanaerobaculia bacterium]